MISLSRRHLLRGLGGIGLALPLLEFMGDPRKLGVRAAHAASNGFPKRVLFVTTSNGCVRGYSGIGTNRWSPSGTATAFDLSTSETLSPLAPNAANLLLLDGLDNYAGDDSDGNCYGNPHNKLATQLTARRYEASTANLYNDAGGGTAKCGAFLTAGGISIDQELANRLKDQTKFPSILMYTGPDPKTFYQSEGYVNGGLGTMKLYASWKAKDQAAIGEFDPVKSFNAIFGGGVTGGTVGGDNSAEIARDKSILDAALESYTGLASKVGKDDKAKLDAHAEAIRSIEKQLDGMSGMPEMLNCTSPTEPAANDLSKFDSYPATLNVQSDLMVAAMACDLTRVGVLEWEPGFSELVHTWLGINKEHHGISHDSGTNDGLGKDAQDKLVKINNWYASQFNALIDKFKAVKEGDGTMFDNTAILWLRELGEGSTHTSHDGAWVLAGTGGGYFKNNLWYKPTGADNTHGNLLLHFLTMFGGTDTVFGDAQYCTGLMSGITA